MGPEVLIGTQDRVTQAAVAQSAAKLVPAGSVAVVTRSGILERTVPVAVVPFETTLNQDMKAVVPHEGIDARWVAWGLRAFERELLRDTRKAGTTVASLEMPRFHAFELPVPSPDEQHRIVNLIEGHLSRLHASRANLEDARRRLIALVKSSLLRSVPDVSSYPRVWKTTTIGAAGEVQLGRQRHPAWHNGPNMGAYLRVANIYEDRIDTSNVMAMHWPDDSYARYRLVPGDILLNEGQTPELVGRAAMYRGDPANVAFTKTLIRFRAGAGVIPDFALLVFRRHMHSGRFTREARITTNIAHLPVIRLKPIEFPVPPIDEQKRIIAGADEMRRAVCALDADVLAAQKRTDKLRRSLLAAAFSGGLA